MTEKLYPTYWCEHCNGEPTTVCFTSIGNMCGACGGPVTILSESTKYILKKHEREADEARAECTRLCEEADLARAESTDLYERLERVRELMSYYRECVVKGEDPVTEADIARAECTRLAEEVEDWKEAQDHLAFRLNQMRIDRDHFKELNRIKAEVIQEISANLEDARSKNNELGEALLANKYKEHEEFWDEVDREGLKAALDMAASLVRTCTGLDIPVTFMVGDVHASD